MDRGAKIKISNLGLGIAIAGFLSILLYFLPFTLLLFAWLDFFGETVGWILRIAIIVLGLIVYYTYDQPDEEDIDSALDAEVKK